MSLPYIPLYVDDYEADTAHLTLLEDGAYNRLLRLLWRTPGCSIPDDDAWIFRRMRAHDEAERAAILTVISEFFERRNGRVSSPRLSREYKKVDETSRKKSAAGKKGGRPKGIEKKEKDEKVSFNSEKLGFDTCARSSEPDPEPDISEANASAADAALADPVDPAKALFDAGVRILGACDIPPAKARQMVGKWRKDHPGQDGEILTAIMDCGRAGAVDPIPWVEARLRPKTQPDIAAIMARLEAEGRI